MGTAPMGTRLIFQVKIINLRYQNIFYQIYLISGTIQCILTSIIYFSDRIPVPNGKSCDSGLAAATCIECTKYYDPTSGFGNNDKGKCVWVPDKMKCYAKPI